MFNCSEKKNIYWTTVKFCDCFECIQISEWTTFPAASGIYGELKWSCSVLGLVCESFCSLKAKHAVSYEQKPSLSWWCCVLIVCQGYTVRPESSGVGEKKTILSISAKIFSNMNPATELDVNMDQKLNIQWTVFIYMHNGSIQ